MSESKNEIYSTNGSKTSAVKIAKQLGYSDEVIKKLENEPDEFKRSRILADARHAGKTTSKVKTPFGYAIVREEPAKRTPKEKPWEQITWRRTTK